MNRLLQSIGAFTIRKILLVPVLAVVLGLVPIRAHASPMDFDFQGNFTLDNDVLLFGFSVNAPSTVTVFSSSWSGGGFDPMLGIWDAAGNNIDFQDDGHNIGATLSNGVPYNHGNWDSYFTVTLNPGSYFASVTQYDNFPVGNNLSQGFQFANNPHFTFDEGFGTQPLFNGVLQGVGGNDPRTSFWQFHLLNVDEAEVVPPGPVPEPASLTLLGLGLAGMGARRWRQRKA